MGSESADLRIFFFPYPAAGHFYPMLTMAHLFSSHPSVSSVTILTTPSNSSLITTMPLLLLPLPPSPLPPGWDSVSSPSSLADFHSIRSSISLLSDPLRQLLRADMPHCLVSDMFLPWTAQVAADLGIPRIVFHGMSCYSLSVIDAIKRYKPHNIVKYDDEEFTVPGLPHAVTMTRAKLPSPLRSSIDEEFASLAAEMEEAEAKSYGVVINSFYELEREFADHYRKTRRAWFVCVRNNRISVKDEDGVISWLERRRPGSVVYVCFGSQVQLPEDRITALAAGLAAASKYSFIWVMKKDSPRIWIEEEEGADKERILVVRGWAPQVAILAHRAVGGFVTHCGWNSVLECVYAGKAMVTMPVYGDQFFNEKLVVEELGIGVKVEDGDVTRAVECVMGGGDGVVGIRERARAVGEMAAKAVEEGGSSTKDLDRLVQELVLRTLQK